MCVYMCVCVWPCSTACASRVGDTRINCECPQSSQDDLDIALLIATLPGAWPCRVSARNGWPSVGIQ